MRRKPKKAAAAERTPKPTAYWIVSRELCIKHRPGCEAECVEGYTPLRRLKLPRIHDAKTGKRIGPLEEQPGALPDIVELRDANSRRLRYVYRPNLLNEGERFSLEMYADNYRKGDRSALLDLAHVAFAIADRLSAIDPAWNEPWLVDLVEKFGDGVERWRNREVRSLEAAFGIRRRRKTGFDGFVEIDGKRQHRSIAIWRAYLDGLSAGMSEKATCEEASRQFGPKWQTIRNWARKLRRRIDDSDRQLLERGDTGLRGPGLPRTQFRVGRPPKEEVSPTE